MAAALPNPDSSCWELVEHEGIIESMRSLPLEPGLLFKPIMRVEVSLDHLLIDLTHKSSPAISPMFPAKPVEFPGVTTGRVDACMQ